MTFPITSGPIHMKVIIRGRYLRIRIIYVDVRWGRLGFRRWSGFHLPRTEMFEDLFYEPRGLYET